MNRYGGWNEYNHNMFIQIWDKYYKDTYVSSYDNLPHFENFKHEILQIMPGLLLVIIISTKHVLINLFYCEYLFFLEMNPEDVIAHSNWYCQYVFLKMQQQNALNKWQENKRKIKKQQPKVKFNLNVNRIFICTYFFLKLIFVKNKYIFFSLTQKIQSISYHHKEFAAKLSQTQKNLDQQVIIYVFFLKKRHF